MKKRMFNRLNSVLFAIAMAFTFMMVSPNAVQKIYAEELEGTEEHVCAEWDDGQVSVAATDEADGMIVYTCNECGETKEEVIPMISSQNLSFEKVIYTGKAQKPSVTVMDSAGNELEKDTDYSVTYATGRTKVGRYKVTIDYTGKYSGSKTLRFTIVPKAVKSVKASLYNTLKVDGHNDVKLVWEKSTGATGYLVYFKKSTAAKWSDPVTVTKLNYCKNNLAANVKYNFKVVPYYQTSSGGTKYYLSGASKTVSITTLKKGAGFVTKNGQKYYEHIKGKYLKNTFATVNKKTYYFDKNGVMKTGWMKNSGSYYYFDRGTGVQKKNCTVDGIKIKANGKATITTLAKQDIELMIKARNKMFKLTKTTDTKEQKLKKVFKWVMDCPYNRYRILPVARQKKGWEITFANDVFDKGKGCCVSEACAFAYLARECGYQTVYVCDDTSHAWVEINGYVYDTLFAVSKNYNTYYKGTYKKANLHCHNKLKI